MERVTGVFSKYRAGRQIARLFSDDMSERDIRDIQRWSSSDRSYQDDFLTTLHALSDIDSLADDADIRAIARSARPAGMLARTTHQWPAYLAVVGVLLFMLVGVNHYIGNKWVPIENTVVRHVTRVGEQKTINLDDGSVITLNTGTQILVDLNESARLVRLERGEVWFSVTADPLRPFTVDVGGRSVTVLGTEFNIMRSPEKFTLAVVTGMVSVHRREEPASTSAIKLSASTGETLKLHAPDQRRIGAGTVVEFDESTQDLLAYKLENSDRLQGWRTGLIQFEEEPLYKVVQELNRYSGKKILIEDASVMNLKVYASVRIDNTDQALSGLERMLPVKVVRYFDRTVIKSK